MLNGIKKLILIIICICFNYRWVSATSAEQYIKIAEKNRLDIQIAEAQINLTKIRVINAARIMGPSILLQYKESDGESIDDPYKSKAYSIQAEQSIFMGRKKLNTLRKELKGLEIARKELHKVEQEIKLETIKSYYNALFVQEKIRNSNGLLEASRNEFIISKKKYQAKIITEVEYLEIKEFKEEIQLNKEMQELDMKLRFLELKAVCGMDIKAEIDLSEDFLEQETEIMELSLERYKEIALKKRPEILSLKALVLQTEYDEKIAKADKWPAISVASSVGKSGEAYVDKKLTLATEWSVYGNVQWVFWGNSLGGKYGTRKTEPSEILDMSVRTKTNERFVQLAILDRLDYYYIKQEKKVSHEQALKELDDMQKKVIMEVEKSYSDIKIALETIRLANSKVELCEKKQEIAEKKYFLDEMSSMDLVRARMEFFKQKDFLMESTAKYNIALAALKLSCGMNVYPLRQIKL